MMAKAHVSRRRTERGLPGRQAGFTLVEMVVAVALFAIVMVVCVGALLSLVNANRKAQALQSVINNVNIALDGIVRNARMGSKYHGAAGDASCGGGNYTEAHDCPNGGTTFAFLPYVPQSPTDRWIYSYNASTHRIEKKQNNGSFIPITAPEVSIDDVRFYVVGADNSIAGNKNIQPKVVIVVKGTAVIPGSASQTTFHIQATAVQRLLDL